MAFVFPLCHQTQIHMNTHDLTANEKLQKKRPLFFNIGLVLALLLCIFAFELKVKTNAPAVVDLDNPSTVVFTMGDVPDIPAPPKAHPRDLQKQTVINPNKIVTTDDPIRKLNNAKLIDQSDLTNVINDFKPGGETADIYDNKTYRIPEVAPHFEGGLQAFYAYLAKSLKYPAREKNLGIEGKVYVSFVIDELGNITHIKVIKGISENLNQEAIRVLKNAPRWQPGMQSDQPVKVRMTIPIHFQLH